MPLIHSKKPSALKKNIATEVKAGKPVKQAVAIGYSVQHEAKRKRMDEGGDVDTASDEPELPSIEAQSEPEQAPDDSEQAPDQDDSEISDMLGQEVMDAIDAKDHKRIMSGLEAIVASHLAKKD